MEDFYSEREPSLSQLFDAIERKLDAMMGAFRYSQFDHYHLDTGSQYDVTSCSTEAPFEKQVRANDLI